MGPRNPGGRGLALPKPGDRSCHSGPGEPPWAGCVELLGGTGGERDLRGGGVSSGEEEVGEGWPRCPLRARACGSGGLGV